MVYTSPPALILAAVPAPLAVHGPVGLFTSVGLEPGVLSCPGPWLWEQSTPPPRRLPPPQRGWNPRVAGSNLPITEGCGDVQSPLAAPRALGPWVGG